MPKFPKRQADIEALAVVMIVGYWNHAADFPSTEVDALSMAYSTYYNVKIAQIQALAAAQVATEQKDTKLAALIEKMKAELKKSEVDVGSDSEKLEYIGWGPKATPAQPAHFKSCIQKISVNPCLKNSVLVRV